MRTGELSMFCTVQSAGWRTFLHKTPPKPMRKQNQSSVPGEQGAKTRVSAHARKEIGAAADAHAASNYQQSPTAPLWTRRIIKPSRPPQRHKSSADLNSKANLGKTILVLMSCNRE